MPYISVKTTKFVSSKKDDILKTKLGKAIECFPGKTEAWLMVSIEDETKMWFKGDNSADSAMIDVCIFGAAKTDAYDRMTKAVTDIVSEELEISPDKIYIKYSEYDRWGWNGNNF